MCVRHSVGDFATVTRGSPRYVPAVCLSLQQRTSPTLLLLLLLPHILLLPRDATRRATRAAHLTFASHPVFTRRVALVVLAALCSIAFGIGAHRTCVVGLRTNADAVPVSHALCGSFICRLVLTRLTMSAVASPSPVSTASSPHYDSALCERYSS